MLGLLKKTTGSTKLPAIDPKASSKVVEMAKASTANETFGLEEDHEEPEEVEEHVDSSKPLYHEYWIRSMDTQKHIYFYNVRTSESSWLGPCGICCKDSHKYCVDCGKAYCDTHFKKRHEKKSRQKHKWQTTDPPNPDKLDPKSASAHCIECSLKEATLMCTDCWDGYCDTCFHLVHHIGDLVYHQGKPYLEAKKGWITIRGTAKEPEYYMHGADNISTFEKPFELMSTLERKFHRQFKKVEARTVDIINEIDKLQFEVEGTKYERDTVFYDAQTNLHELHAKHAEHSKPKEGNLLDHSKLKPSSGVFGSLFGGNMKEKVYVNKLLNPTDRSRGEARTEYIKQVIETSTAGIVKHDESEHKKHKKKKG